MPQDRRSLKSKILSLFGRKNYRPLDRTAIARELELDRKDRVALGKTLRDLERAAEIARVRKNCYVLPTEADLVSGKLSIHQAGFGFLSTDTPGQPDIFIAAENTGTAMHGDRVVARIMRDVPPARRKNR